MTDGYKKERIIVPLCFVIILGTMMLFYLGKTKRYSIIKENETVESLKISFNIDENKEKEIAYDFLEHIKYIIISDDSGVDEDKISVNKAEEQKLQEFLKTIKFEYSEKVYLDEQEQEELWNIRIWTRENFYGESAFIGEDYPPYWNDLMNLIGEIEYLQIEKSKEVN